MYLLCTVIMYVSLSNTSFMDAYGCFSYPMLAAWWAWARWVLMLNIVWICQGVWFFLEAMYVNYKLRRPWVKFERTWSAEDEPALDIDGLTDGNEGHYRRRPQNQLASEGALNIMFPVLIVFFGLLTIGLVMKSRTYVAGRKREIARLNALNDALQAAIGPELFRKFGHFILSSKIDPAQLPDLSNPYEINQLLNVPLGPAIKIARGFLESAKASEKEPASTTTVATTPDPPA